MLENLTLLQEIFKQMYDSVVISSTIGMGVSLSEAFSQYMLNAVDFVCLSGTIPTVPIIKYYHYIYDTITVIKGRIHVYCIYNYLSNLEGGSCEGFSPIITAKILYTKISNIELTGELLGYYGGCLITNGDSSSAGKFTYQLDSILILKDGSWVGRKNANLYGRGPLSNTIMNCAYFKTAILVYLSQDAELFESGAYTLPSIEELEITIEISKYQVDNYKLISPSLLSEEEARRILTEDTVLRLKVYYDGTGKYTRQSELCNPNTYRTILMDILRK
jgi:hypothetical protein